MPRVRTTTLQKRKDAGEPIAMLTAYDYPFAKLIDEAGADVILVGDSLAAVVQGRETTLGVTMDQMVYHTSLVARAAERALVVADMPFLSYHVSPEEAVRNAGRLVAEAGAHAVKVEGPAGRIGGAIAAILRAGIPVMGHLGLTPQSIHQIGGPKLQGKDEEAQLRLTEEAGALQELGCFALVLEFVAAPVAEAISRQLRIPAIGIGAGAGCDGQVLVMHDMLGFGEAWTFIKVFGDAKTMAAKAFADYVREVKEGAFPGPEHERR